MDKYFMIFILQWNGESVSCSGLSNSQTAWTVANQAPLSMEFSRQEYCSGLQCPPPGDLPDIAIEPTLPVFPALARMFFTSSTSWEAPQILYGHL